VREALLATPPRCALSWILELVRRAQVFFVVGRQGEPGRLMNVGSVRYVVEHADSGRAVPDAELACGASRRSAGPGRKASRFRRRRSAAGALSAIFRLRGVTGIERGASGPIRSSEARKKAPPNWLRSSSGSNLLYHLTTVVGLESILVTDDPVLTNRRLDYWSISSRSSGYGLRFETGSWVLAAWSQLRMVPVRSRLE
jgi:hypothetical protein